MGRLNVDADWYTRADDTSATMTATLKDGAGTVVDVTGATVLFKAYGPGDDISETCTLDDATNGVVSVIPTFDDAGTYYGRFHVTFGGGTILTFPTDDDIVIQVRPPE